MRRAFIASCGSTTLAAEERALFRDCRPAGLILFQRNCASPEQVQALTHAFREAVGEADTLILIDQEGGRVQRLVPPVWAARPAAARFGELYRRDPERAVAAARCAARLVARELASVGITMNCAPVLDLRWPETHAVIGDRAYDASVEVVAALGRAVAEGLIIGGVVPVIKHIPGHGRASKDSHHELPVVAAPRGELIRTDFAAFRALRDMPAAMTAHIVFADIDASEPASTSLTVTQDIIRGEIGFDGLLMSDDLGMHALRGTVADRTRGVRYAGCDLALHCNGDVAEQRAVAAAAGDLNGLAQLRYARCLALLGERPEFDVAAAEAELAAALA